MRLLRRLLGSVGVALPRRQRLLLRAGGVVRGRRRAARVAMPVSLLARVVGVPLLLVLVVLLPLLQA